MVFTPALGHRSMEKAGTEFLQQTDWQTPKAESLVDFTKSEGTGVCTEARTASS